MPVGPGGNIIYANQVMHLQAVKQTDYQNSIPVQGVIAAAMSKEKGILETERKKKLATGEEKASEIETASEGKIKEVVDFLKKELERTINVAS